MSPPEHPDLLWYIPNTVEPGHRGDDTRQGWGSLDYSARLALACERHGWSGALLGTSWGRPDTFTVATALAARTTTFRPWVAVEMAMARVERSEPAETRLLAPMLVERASTVAPVR